MLPAFLGAPPPPPPRQLLPQPRWRTYPHACLGGWPASSAAELGVNLKKRCSCSRSPPVSSSLPLRYFFRWGQLLDAVMAEAAEEEGEEAAPSADVLANKFRSLVIERYVERVPPCNLPPPAQQASAAGWHAGGGGGGGRAGGGRGAAAAGGGTAGGGRAGACRPAIWHCLHSRQVQGGVGWERCLQPAAPGGAGASDINSSAPRAGRGWAGRSLPAACRRRTPTPAIQRQPRSVAAKKGSRAQADAFPGSPCRALLLPLRCTLTHARRKQPPSRAAKRRQTCTGNRRRRRSDSCTKRVSTNEGMLCTLHLHGHLLRVACTSGGTGAGRGGAAAAGAKGVRGLGGKAPCCCRRCPTLVQPVLLPLAACRIANLAQPAQPEVAVSSAAVLLLSMRTPPLLQSASSYWTTFQAVAAAVQQQR